MSFTKLVRVLRRIWNEDTEIQALRFDLAAKKSLLLEAGWYIRSAAVFEPDGDVDPEDMGHALADRIFDEIGVDRTGPEHAHDRFPLD